MMRAGRGALEAAVEVLERIRGSFELAPRHQVGVLALRPDGDWAAASLRPGFKCAVADGDGERVVGAQRALLG